MPIKRASYLIAFGLSILFYQCAKQTTPTGGPKDESPPKLIKSNPEQGQIKFSGKSIELTFDELVQLNNPREQIIITPAIKKKFEIIAKKNKVILTFEETLQDSTTYNINFRESIQDVNERNPTQAKLAFSTGNYIDSLSISGIVVDHLTEAPNKNYTVALTPASDTFNIFKHKGLWLTQADKEGSFTLENLKPGNYFLYAFDDKNKNMIADSKSERYGFISTNINLKKNIDSLRISTYKLDASPLKVITARPTFNYYLIRFSKGLASYSIINKESSDKIYYSIEPENNALRVYNTFSIPDSLKISIVTSDSIQQKSDTTVYLKFNKKESTKDKISYKVLSNQIEESTSLLKAQIQFTKPIYQFLADSIWIKTDSSTLIKFNKEEFTWNQTNTEITFQKKLPVKQTESPPTTATKKVIQPSPINNTEAKDAQEKPKEVYNILTFSKGTFISVQNDTVAKIAETPKSIKIKDTGILSVKVETKENFIIQIINRSGKVVTQSLNTASQTFNNLPPDTYQLRLVIDENKNGVWDGGNPLKKEKPEPIIFYINPKGEKTINLKANWELGPLLITF